MEKIKQLSYVLNSNISIMGSQVCILDLAKKLENHGYSVVQNDWENYIKYDVAIFMGIDCDIIKARQQNPKIKIIIGDPKIY